MKTFYAAIIGAFLAGPAIGQERMTPILCEASLQVVEGFVGQAERDSVEVTDDGWCRLTGTIFTGPVIAHLRIDSLIWRGSDVGRLMQEGLPPRSLEVVAEGMRVEPSIGDSVSSYLYRIQASPTSYSAKLSVRWDGVQNAILIDEAEFRFDDTNSIAMTARVEGVDLTNMASLQTSAGTAGLRNLSVKLEFDGWFEHHVAWTLGQELLEDGDVSPEAQVIALQRQAIDAVETFPFPTTPSSSRAALAEFIAALPHPEGVLQVQIQAEPPFGMRQLMPLNGVGYSADPLPLFEAALEGIVVLVTWAPK